MSQRVLHSTNDAGRHWLTMDTEPPLQIGPVAPNHCRIGYHILQAVYDALCDLEDGASVPEEIDIRMEDGDAPVRVALPMLPGPDAWGSAGDPEGDGDNDDADAEGDEDDGPVLFLTVTPQGGVAEGIDEWILPMAEALDLDPEPAVHEGGYERAMQSARELTQAALPEVREQFLALKGEDPQRPSFGFKLGLPTEQGGVEWVWIQPTTWTVPEQLTATLESQPAWVPGHTAGQTLDVLARDLVDYIVYHPATGEREGGFTDRIAADYGLVIPS